MTSLISALPRRIGAPPPDASPLAVAPWGGGHLIVFVVDRSDNLFEQVLHRDEPSGAAKLIEHDREMSFLPLHVGQHVFDLPRAGNEERRAGDVLYRSLGTGEEAAQNVLGVYDADDVVERLAGDRVARAARGSDPVGGLGERRLGR